jgi:hypothetical protein
MYNKSSYHSKILEDKFNNIILTYCGRIILKCILKEQGVRQLIGFFWQRIGSSDGLFSYERGNEPLYTGI